MVLTLFTFNAAKRALKSDIMNTKYFLGTENLYNYILEEINMSKYVNDHIKTFFPT